MTVETHVGISVNRARGTGMARSWSKDLGVSIAMNTYLFLPPEKSNSISRDLYCNFCKND
jgi:hypothetical protein